MKLLVSAYCIAISALAAETLPERAVSILEKRCGACHAGTMSMKIGKGMVREIPMTVSVIHFH